MLVYSSTAVSSSVAAAQGMVYPPGYGKEKQYLSLAFLILYRVHLFIVTLSFSSRSKKVGVHTGFLLGKVALMLITCRVRVKV